MHVLSISQKLEEAIKKDDVRLYILRLYSDIVSNLTSDSCQKPNLTNVVYLNILDRINITDEEIKRVTKGLYKEHWTIANDPTTNIFLFLCSAALKIKEERFATVLMSLALLTEHGKLMKKYFRTVCKQEVMMYALDTMHTRSYIKKHGNFILVYNAISKYQIEKFKDRLSKYEDSVYIDAIVSNRNKLNQFMKVIAKRYFKAIETKSYIRSAEDTEYQAASITGKQINMEYTIDSVLSNMSQHPTIENDVFETMSKLFRLDRNAMSKFSNDFMDMKNSKHVENLLVAILNESKITAEEQICGDKLASTSKLLLISRRPVNPYKEELNDLMDSGMKSIGKNIKQISSETKSKLMGFYNYLFLYVVNRTFCK